MRGIRHKPAEGRDAPPSLMSDARWRDGYARLAELGLHFELQAPDAFLHEAAELAAAYDATPMVVNHTGLPADRSERGLAAWRAGMREVAELPHVSVKISGLGGPGGWWDCEANTRLIREVIGIFGVDRCMFASNYPVDSLCVSFPRMYACYVAAVADLLPVRSASSSSTMRSASTDCEVSKALPNDATMRPWRF